MDPTGGPNAMKSVWGIPFTKTLQTIKAAYATDEQKLQVPEEALLNSVSCLVHGILMKESSK